MYMPDEDKIILTFGHTSYDMSMFVRKMGFRAVDVIHTEYMNYEAILDSDRDLNYYQVQLNELAKTQK